MEAETDFLSRQQKAVVVLFFCPCGVAADSDAVTEHCLGEASAEAFEAGGHDGGDGVVHQMMNVLARAEEGYFIFNALIF